MTNQEFKEIDREIMSDGFPHSRLIRCLTVWQPGASLGGMKRIETRSWPTSYRRELYIHAAARPADMYFCGLFYKEMVEILKEGNGLPIGALVARCELVDCRKILTGIDTLTGKTKVQLWKPCSEPLYVSGDELLYGDYSNGRYAWLLDNIERLPEPITCKGHQGIWTYEID
jgi:activating signal cointegrator 1